MAVANVHEEDVCDFTTINDEPTKQLGDKSDWMANRDVSITELAIPGSHDSFAYNIDVICWDVLLRSTYISGPLHSPLISQLSFRLASGTWTSVSLPKRTLKTILGCMASTVLRLKTLSKI